MGSRRLLCVSVVAWLALAAVGTASSVGAPRFGNPDGRFHVPPAGRAVNTDHPNHVIGSGTPGSCTSAAVVRDVAAGGITTFNCGSEPVTIVMTRTADVIKTRRLVVLDGGGLITLSGGGKRGWGALTFNESHLHRNISGEFQTFPGVYYDLDGNDRPPVMIRSTDG